MMENTKKILPNSGLCSSRFITYPTNTNNYPITINNHNGHKAHINSINSHSLKNAYNMNNRGIKLHKQNLNFSNNSINSSGKASTNNIDEQSISSNNSLKSIINKIQFPNNKEIPVHNLKNKKYLVTLNNSKLSNNKNSLNKHDSINTSNNNIYVNNTIKNLSSSGKLLNQTINNNNQKSLIIKEKIQNAKLNEEILLPSIEIHLDSFNITKPIKIKGQPNSYLYINEGPISIDFESFNNKNNIKNNNNNIVKFSQIQIVYNDNNLNKEKKISSLFKIHPCSFLELEDCDIVFRNKKNEHKSSSPPQNLGGNKEKKSVAFLLLSNKKDEKNKNFNPSVLNLTNTRVHNFYQSIRAGQNCIININKSAFIKNYGKAIVMINPIFLKISETLFEYNEDNNIHVKFLDECLLEEKRKLFFNKNEFDKSICNNICIEGVKNDKLDLSIVISKNNFHNTLSDGVLIYELIYNYFEITNNIFQQNKGNGLNIQKSFFNNLNNGNNINNINNNINNNLYQPIKIKNNQFIENKGFGLFINDCIIELISNKFTLNRQSGIILCNIIIDDPKKGLEGINLNSIKGDFSSIINSKTWSSIIKNSFYENGECGLYIYGYPYKVNIQESIFNSNIKNGLLIDLDCLYTNNNIFLTKLNEYKSITQIQKIYDLCNILLNKCIIEKNMKNGILLNSCLIYCEETFIINNLNYAISIKRKEYQNCFKEGKKNIINGTMGGDWGEIDLNKEIHCGFGCMPKSEIDYKMKEEIIKNVPFYLNQSDDNRSIDEGLQKRKEQSFTDFNLNNIDKEVYKRIPSAPVNNNKKDIEDEGGCYIF